MIGGGAVERSEGQGERSTPLLCRLCRNCGTMFEAKNRNGVVKEFCKRACKDAHKNAQRLRAVSQLKAKQARKAGPSKHAEKVSRFVLLNMGPVDQRAELLRAAAQNLGITDEGELLKALRRNGCTLEQAIRHQPSAISSGGSQRA